MTALRDAIDYTTLGWVKPELDETLRQARMEIEGFADDPTDSTRMRFCASYLHQVQGTLRMVELYAPAMVAEEMERLAQALQNDQTGDRDTACAVLMRGVVLLPDYLERLQSGHKDIPIVLLPLLNELRAARGEGGLSESVLFAPDLERPLPDDVPAPLEGNEPVRTAGAAPHLAQLREAMSAWPEAGAPADAAALAPAFEALIAHARQEPARRMLWVAASVARAMEDGALDAGAGLRQAFASVEREARRMFEDDGFGLPRAEAALEPTRQLLYHVAHGKAGHPLLDELRRTFDLDAQQPTETEISHAQGSLSGRNRALLDTVAAAVKEDLLRVKDALDLHLRTGETDLGRLRPEVESLGRVADTLGMLGLGVARTVVQQQRDAMDAIVRGDRAADEGALLDVAGALLYVDASLDDQVARLGTGDEADAEQDDLFASEAHKVLEVVVREAIANFADARQAFVAFVETNWDHGELVEVPRLLEEVGGALMMLELPRPAEFLTGVRRYTETELIGRRRVPNGRQLDTFADALASLEYYLEALRENRFNRDDILDVARTSLEILGYWPLPAEGADPMAGARQDAVLPPSADDRERTVAAMIDRSDDVAAYSGAHADDSHAERTRAVDDAAVRVPPASVEAPIAAPPPVSAEGVASGGFESTGDEIDDEIREVFLEEFAEEIDNLDHLLPPWRAAPDDLERLRPIRRVFHTLKGSGRLVGARTLGEFSWKIESLLNRVLDGTRAPTPAVVAMVDQAFYTLPQLQAALRGEGPVRTDLGRMQASAERITQGDDAMPDQAVDAGGVVGTVAGALSSTETGLLTAAVAVPATVMLPAAVDALLLEILDVEVAGHLVTVDEWLSAAAAGDRHVTDALLRAIHTMNGAFAMTEVPAIVDALAPAEGYVRRLLAAALDVEPDGLAAMGELAALIRATIVGLHRESPSVPACEALAARLGALRDRHPLPESMAPAFGQDDGQDDASAGGESGPQLGDVDLSEYGELSRTAGDAAAIAGSLSGFAGGEVDAGGREASHEEAARVEAERFEAERVESERVEAERVESERVEAERVESERVEAERIEAERIEAERIEAERIEAERIEAERIEAERVEFERAEAERVESERVEAERIEAERVEFERAEADRVEAERVEAARLEAEQVERIEAERLEAERVESERSQAERLEAQLAEAQRADAQGGSATAGSEPDGSDGWQHGVPSGEPEVAVDSGADAPVAADWAEAGAPGADVGAVDTATERARIDALEAALLESTRIDAERAETERVEAERLDAERLEAERSGSERLEAERLETERAEAERLEAERLETERAEAERLEAERLEAERLEAERLEAERLEAERVESEREAALRTQLEDEAEYARLEVEYARVAAAEAERNLPEPADRIAGDGVEADAHAAATSALLVQSMAHGDPDEPLDLTGLDPELVDIFVEEAGDILDHSDGVLSQLRDAPGEREPLIGLQRDLHTLKGGARMAGIMPIGELGHAMESLLEAVVEQRSELGRDGIPLLERGFDRLHAMVTRVGDRRAVGLPLALVDEFNARARGRTRAEREEQASVPARLPAPKVALKPLSAPIDDRLSADDDDVGVRAPQEQVRIRADLLDRLVTYAGEVAIYRARLEQQLGAFRAAMSEMEQTNMRLRDQLRRLDIETEAQIIARYQREGDSNDATFDPLELDRFSTLQQLSRALGESATDMSSLQGTLDDLTRQYETLLLQQSRVSSDLQEGLMRTRMVPFDALVPRLRRVVRQAAGDTGKQVQLKLDGAQGELDRNVLERMTAPLEHMLRNAVAHGLESAERRREAGKQEEGTVRIGVRREGSEVVLEVGDDGAGLDRDAIRRRGEERGLLRTDATVTDGDLDMLIFEPGFSTVDEVSRLAGRGVGMDVVASEVRQLGGTLDIVSRRGEGTQFTLRLPQTLAVTQAVFVRIGETSYAVPIASVRGVGRLVRGDAASPGAVYGYGGEDYTVHDLGGLVGLPAARAEGLLQMPVLLIRSGDLRAAVVVDQIVGNREIVVKPVGPQVASVPGIFGATIMGDGSVVVILDVAPLVRRQAVLPRDEAPAAPPEARHVPLVMVVDDSVTMRKVTGRVLERHNFEVTTAKDGIDALERMAERVPDLMLLDIEMPRMDGYELATQMKLDPRLRDVPIVMITSRTGEKHRQRAFEIGVERYLGKPYQENELIRNVYDLLKLSRDDV